jgi:hypothetical protein
MSYSTSVDVANIQLSLRDYATQQEIPGAVIALSVHYQQLSNSIEAGALVEFGFRGKRHATGLRLGHNRSTSQIAEDALRVGLEYATAFLLAERFGLDLGSCPMPDELSEEALRADGPAKAANQIPQEFTQMQPTDRQAWVAARLPALGYAFKRQDPESQRRALAKFQLRHGLPPTGELDVSTFLRMSQTKPSGNTPTAGSALRVTTPWLDRAAEFHSLLQATVVAPRPGNLYCLFADASGVVPIFPRSRSQAGFVTGRAQQELTNVNYQIALSQPGQNQLWCMLTEGAVLSGLPVSLQPGGNGDGFTTLGAAAQAALQTAKDQLLASGETGFVVNDPPKKPEEPRDHRQTQAKPTQGAKPARKAAPAPVVQVPAQAAERLVSRRLKG